ncbi:MAG TPA: hypothetical protein VEA16_15610 [Vicinamibacterales bacterium]|nr:hypothetical protein [Vicinamibacterales bacterium]
MRMDRVSSPPSGRRFNVVDVMAGVLVLLLVPLGYGTYLLFRPATPRIDSVEPSIITREEERISVGGRLVAKFKVKGSGFTPLLRARIGEADALALVFENPNSADVLVGPVAPGSHDLVLIDGVQEVARARGAISIQSEAASVSIVAAGWLIGLDEAQVQSLAVGVALPEGAPAFRVLALGPLMPGFRQVALAGSAIDVPVPGSQARRALLSLNCGASIAQNPCTLGERAEHRIPPVTISLPGAARPFNFSIDEILPSAPPAPATLRVRLSAPAAIRTGDRDELLDQRAATVTAVAGDIVTLDAGVDRFHDGWRYRGQRLRPGAPLVFTTDRYEARGVLQSVEVRTTPP